MQQIALDTELMRPAANVMTTDAAVEYEMKLFNQAIERSLHDQVNIKQITGYLQVIQPVLLQCCFVCRVCLVLRMCFICVPQLLCN